MLQRRCAKGKASHKVVTTLVRLTYKLIVLLWASTSRDLALTVNQPEALKFDNPVECTREASLESCI